jgi:hypothetical protein
MNSFGVLVTETAEMAVTPIADTILESITFAKVVNSVSRKDGTPISSISFTLFLSSGFILLIDPFIQAYSGQRSMFMPFSASKVSQTFLQA